MRWIINGARAVDGMDVRVLLEAATAAAAERAANLKGRRKKVKRGFHTRWKKGQKRWKKGRKDKREKIRGTLHLLKKINRGRLRRRM